MNESRSAMNSTSSYSSRLDAWETGIAWVSFTLITATGLAGNLFVIVAIVGSAPMRHSVMNLLLMNLAIADFLNLVSCSVDWIQILLAGSPVWLLPDTLCPIVRYLNEVFLYSSVLLQVFICVERYVATAHPLRVRQICTTWSLVFWVSGTWAISATFALPYVINYHVVRTGLIVPVKRCTPFKFSLLHSVVFKTAECLSFYFIPLVLLAVLYWRIARLLWNNTTYLHESIRQSGRVAALARIRGLFFGGTIENFCTLLGRRRVVKMLVCCVAVYFVCFSPLQFIFISQVVFNQRIFPPFSVIMAMNALCYASSACNPILYTLFSTRFRLRFAQLIFGASGCGRTRSAFLPNWTFTRHRSRSQNSASLPNAASNLAIRRSAASFLHAQPSRTELIKRESASVGQERHHRPMVRSDASYHSKPTFDRHLHGVSENVELAHARSSAQSLQSST